MQDRRQFLGTFGATAVGSAIGGPAFGASYPSKPINWIVPFKAGGGSDVKLAI